MVEAQTIRKPIHGGCILKNVQYFSGLVLFMSSVVSPVFAANDLT